jgi:hypothetical protein
VVRERGDFAGLDEKDKSLGDPGHASSKRRRAVNEEALGGTVASCCARSGCEPERSSVVGKGGALQWRDCVGFEPFFYRKFRGRIFLSPIQIGAI